MSKKNLATLERTSTNVIQQKNVYDLSVIITIFSIETYSQNSNEISVKYRKNAHKILSSSNIIMLKANLCYFQNQTCE